MMSVTKHIDRLNVFEFKPRILKQLCITGKSCGIAAYINNILCRNFDKEATASAEQPFLEGQQAQHQSSFPLNNLS
jgi:hypothetical protein